jgi:hypothetical protein
MPGRNVGDADRRIGGVDVLAAGAGRAHRVDANILGGLRYRCPRPRQHGDGRGGGVDAPAGLGLGHPLNPVDAGFELQPRKHALAGNGGDDFLVAAGLALTG